LRRAADSNLPLDWENLAEEIESLGASQRTELNSQVRRVLRHLSHDLEDHGEHADAVWARLEKGGFTAEEILGDWFPEAAELTLRQALPSGA
jgi:Domain of unknown function DUF29